MTAGPFYALAIGFVLLAGVCALVATFLPISKPPTTARGIIIIEEYK